MYHSVSCPMASARCDPEVAASARCDPEVAASAPDLIKDIASGGHVRREKSCSCSHESSSSCTGTTSSPVEKASSPVHRIPDSSTYKQDLQRTKLNSSPNGADNVIKLITDCGSGTQANMSQDSASTDRDIKHAYNTPGASSSPALCAVAVAASKTDMQHIGVDQSAASCDSQKARNLEPDVCALDDSVPSQQSNESAEKGIFSLSLDESPPTAASSKSASASTSSPAITGSKDLAATAESMFLTTIAEGSHSGAAELSASSLLIASTMGTQTAEGASGNVVETGCKREGGHTQLSSSHDLPLVTSLARSTSDSKGT